MVAESFIMRSAGRNAKRLAALSCVAALSALAGIRAEGELRITFGHVLADFTGPVAFGDAPLAADRASGEVLVADGRDVKVFNEYGMQVFLLRSPYDLATVIDIAVEPDGHILTLARDLDAPGDHPRIVLTRHDFRGTPVGEVEISDAPPPFAGLLPNRVFSLENGLLFASTMQLLAVATRRDGVFERGYDLGRILDIGDEDRHAVEITGLDVDRKGNLLLTCAVMFRAFEVSPDGKLVATWGQPGSARGTFGVAAGITRDDRGRTYVADKNRSVVMVFDDQYRLIDEFADGPSARRALGLPSRLLADSDRLYVSQVGNRGVWVYDIRSK